MPDDKSLHNSNSGISVIYSAENKMAYSSHSSKSIIYNRMLFSGVSKSEPELHSHDVCELIFLKKGDVSYINDGKTYKLKKNTLVFTRPSELHALVIDSNCDYDRYDVLFKEEILPPTLYQKLTSENSVVDFEGNNIVKDIFKKMEFYCENFEGEELDAILLSLVHEVCCNLVLKQGKTISSSGNSVVDRAIEYIDENLTTLESITKICDELYIAKSHLHHLFKKHLNITPKQYLMSKRLILAQREIYSGRRPTEVYEQFGFNDYSAFYRDFKKFFGYSPSKVGKVEITQEIKS